MSEEACVDDRLIMADVGAPFSHAARDPGGSANFGRSEIAEGTVLRTTPAKPPVPTPAKPWSPRQPTSDPAQVVPKPRGRSFGPAAHASRGDGATRSAARRDNPR
jgi:hypothetical protein